MRRREISFPGAAALRAGRTLTQPTLLDLGHRSGKRARRAARGCVLRRWRAVQWVRVAV